MLDVSKMTVEQFEDLLNKPKLSYGTFCVELDGVRIELSNWLNKYCIGVLAGSEYLDYIEGYLEVAGTEGMENLPIDVLLKVSLGSYMCDNMGICYNEDEFSRVYEVLLSVKESLLRFKILRGNRSLPIFEVFRMIKEGEE